MRAFLCVFRFFAICLFAVLSHADAVYPAASECLATCSVTETARLDFATLQRPSSGTASYTVPTDGGAANGTATVLYGTAARGQYRVNVSGNTRHCSRIVYDAQTAGSGNAGITIGKWKGSLAGKNFSLPYSPEACTPPGNSTLYIGATATISSSAAKGSFSPAYNVTCTIE
jgi:hypothetical protein